MPLERRWIGIDLGGSKLRAGLVSASGQLDARIEIPTEASRGVAHVLANLKQVVTRLIEAAAGRVEAIGIAAAGHIHGETQAVVYAPNLEWEDVPLRAEIRTAFGIPVCVENDVRAAAWGEYRFGVGRGASSLIAVFVGTGIGSGAVVEGLLVRGASNVAGELGHTQVVDDGVPCACGQRGCVEAYASGRGLARRLEAALATGATTRLRAPGDGGRAAVTAADVARAARAGDDLARELWGDAVRYLGVALANYVTLLNPEILILGGGVVGTVPGLLEEMAARVAARTTRPARRLRVSPAGLGESAGIVGAADRARMEAGS
jgi:glucokinase